MLSVTTLLSLVVFTRIQGNIYLYNTEDGVSVEFYDCISIKTLSYCRRPEVPINLIRDNDTNSCRNNGGIWRSFAELHWQQDNVSTILHEWKSSIERAEQYSRYGRVSRGFNGSLCQCTDPESFGKSCEYRLPVGTTVDETIDWQLKLKVSNSSRSQMYGDITCYVTYQCDSGLLCLDWREICDGIQHCMLGFDEINCDILELNLCDDDEYRCMNGMCIPDEYFLDGELDCLDWSDEIPFKNDTGCAIDGASTSCDDRICPSTQWSCGDGQCIPERLGFRNVTSNPECVSRRDQYFMCETHDMNIQWTMDNGRCYRGIRYANTSGMNRSVTDLCLYLLRCALSLGAGNDCPCQRGSDCITDLNLRCPLSTLQYPSSAIIAPYVFSFYTRPNDSAALWSPWILINGTVLCHGMPVSILRKMPFKSDWSVHRIIEEVFCNQWREKYLPESMGFTQQCYRSNNSVDICNSSKACMSSSRIKDGFVDCINHLDELIDTEICKSYSLLPHHRFRCSSQQLTHLSVMALGDQQSQCQNKFDQLWLGGGRPLSGMNCNEQRTEECSAIREYIEKSWTPMGNHETHVDFRLPFRSYCDSFWDMDSKDDEESAECRDWWVCTQDQWKCRTGQCIDSSWVGDGEWDCVDAADEEQLLYNRSEALQQKQSHVNFSDALELPFAICNRTHPFPCLSVHAVHQTVSCISLDRIGDGQMDCLGAVDERNTLKHCSEPSILVYNFNCLSSNVCIPYWRHCYPLRCPNPIDDEKWCS